MQKPPFVPKCQAAARAEWLAARQAELRAVPYFHIVFTLPPAVAEIAFQNKQTVYGLLIRAAAQALMTLAAERLGAKIGLIAVLHSTPTSMSFSVARNPCPI